ncbi:MAG TPA: hypothetical protein VMF06_08400 [Candidatus Limnocylindria bacterium]|jgi:proteasome alpha subunit|nr:hypothetical protein [Candidatus Limnocylindria bacterium]
MTEEPYRWLEAIANRREYVQEQLRGGRPGFAVSGASGILLAAPGSGGTKVFEIHDRIAMVAMGHPADIERVRQILIDASHVESFTRSAADVSLARLVASSLAPVLKQNFEQLFSPPVLVELLLAEVGGIRDTFVRVRPDGSYATSQGPLGLVTTEQSRESTLILELATTMPRNLERSTAFSLLSEVEKRLKSDKRAALVGAVEGEEQDCLEIAFLRRATEANRPTFELL